MNLKFLKVSEKKRLIVELEKQFGISNLGEFGILIESGKQKIRGFTGHMSKDEIRELSEIANVEIVGMYLIKRDGQLRLSLDGSFYLGGNAEKRVYELSDEQLDDWMNGKSLGVVKDSGVWIIKCGSDFLGCGISDGKKLINYMPRERRIRRS
jgi:NOL1/NOP2/fmu family ribosome biogenesis protein